MISVLVAVFLVGIVFLALPLILVLGTLSLAALILVALVFGLVGFWAMIRRNLPGRKNKPQS